MLLTVEFPVIGPLIPCSKACSLWLIVSLRKVQKAGLDLLELIAAGNTVDVLDADLKWTGLDCLESSKQQDVLEVSDECRCKVWRGWARAQCL